MESNRGDSPRFEAVGTPEGGNESIVSSEKLASSPEATGSTQQAPPIQLPPDLPIATPPATLSQDDNQISTPTNNSASTHHADRIEKEWVDKAKNILAANREDPFKQKNEMSKIKAEYIQKRFNKTIKVSEA